jgi:hypothetical protein
MGKILLFIDHSGNNQFDFGREYEAIDQYPIEDSLENKQIFVC